MIKRFPDYYEAEPEDMYSFTDEEGCKFYVYTQYLFGIVARRAGKRGKKDIAGSLLYQHNCNDGLCVIGFRGWYPDPVLGRLINDHEFSPWEFQDQQPAAHEQAAREYLGRVFLHDEPRWVGRRLAAQVGGRSPSAHIDPYFDLRMDPKLVRVAS